MSQGELFDGIIRISVQDDDAPGRITAILDEVRQRFVAAFSSLPGVGTDLIEAGIGQQVTTIDQAIAQMERLRGVMTEVQGQMARGNSNALGTAYIDAQISALDRLLAKSREVAAFQEQVARTGGLTPVGQAEQAARQAVDDRRQVQATTPVVESPSASLPAAGAAATATVEEAADRFTGAFQEAEHAAKALEALDKGAEGLKLKLEKSQGQEGHAVPERPNEQDGQRVTKFGASVDSLAARLETGTRSVAELAAGLEYLGATARDAKAAAVEAFRNAGRPVAEAEVRAADAVAARGPLASGTPEQVIASREAILDAGAQARLTDEVTQARGKLAKAVETVQGHAFDVTNAGTDEKARAAQDRLDSAILTRDRASAALAKAEERLTAATDKQAAVSEADAQRQANKDLILKSPYHQAALEGDTDHLLNTLGVDRTASVKAQQLQLDLAILERKQVLLAAASQEAASEGDTARLTKLAEDQARLRLQIEAKRNSAEELSATEARAGRGNGGFVGGVFGRYGGGLGDGGFGDLANQAGFALKYYAFYQAFAFGQKAIEDVKENTKEYSLAVNQLSIALGTNYDEASRVAQKYVEIGNALATGPATAVEAATQFQRAFGQESPGAGATGARVGSYINLLEGGKPEEQEKLREDLVAIAENYGGGAQGAADVYDAATSIAQSYQYAKGGQLLSGFAQIADLTKESGYSREEGLALIASVMQRTGGTSDEAAGDLKRFLGRSGQQTFQDVFSQFGINANQTLEQQLAELAKGFDRLNETQRTTIISRLGGGRAGAAVAAAILDYQKQQEAASKAQDSQGIASEQAAQRLATFGGQIEKLSADWKRFTTDIGNSGLGQDFAFLLRFVDATLNGVDGLLRVFSEAPNAIKDTAAAVVTLTVALRALGAAQGEQGLVNGISAGLNVLGPKGRLGLNGTPLLFGRGARAAESAVPALTESGAARVFVAGAAGTTVVEAEAATAALTTKLGGLAAGAGTAAAALAPLVAIIAGIAALGAVEGAYNKAKTGAQGAIDNQKEIEAARSTGDVAQLKALADRQRDNAKLVDESKEGVGGSLLYELLHPSYFGHPGGLARQRIDTVNGIQGQARELDFEAHQAELYKEQQSAAEAAAQAKIEKGGSADSRAFFGEDYSNIDHGLTTIETKSLSASASVRVLNDLLKHIGTSPSGQLADLLQPTQGQEGLPDVIQKLITKLQKSTNPLEQQQGLGQLRSVAKTALEGAKAGGDAAQIEAANDIVNNTDKAYFDVLVKNTQAKIASVKAINGDNAKTRATITSLARNALRQAEAAGDVDAVVALLAGVDKAFVSAEAKALAGMRAVVQNTLNALQSMASLGRQAQVAVANAADARAEQALTGHTTGNTVTSGADAAAAAENQKKIEDARRQLAQYDKMLATFKTGLSLSAPSGSDFQFPKDAGAAKGPSGPSARDIEIARLQAQEIPNDPLSAASTSLRVATYQLRTAKDRQEYYQALKELHQAQYDYAEAILQQQASAQLLRIDITDPVAQAREKVREAQAQLTFDRRRGALSDVTTKDAADLRQAKSDADKAAFEQQFSDAQTNYQLQRISLGAYLSYLRSQHDYLTNVKHKTRQQVDELNEVDQALKSIADQMEGQFNLGDIKVPTVYEVRRAVATQAAYSSTVNNVTISFDGSDLNAVRSVLSEYLGQGAVQVVGSSVGKV